MTQKIDDIDDDTAVDEFSKMEAAMRQTFLC